MTLPEEPARRFQPGDRGWTAPYPDTAMCGHGVQPASECQLCTVRGGPLFAVGDRVGRLNPESGGLQRGTVTRPKVALASGIGRIPVLFDGEADPVFVMPTTLRPLASFGAQLPPGAQRLQPGEEIKVLDVAEYLLVATLDVNGVAGLGGNGQLMPREVAATLRRLADMFEQQMPGAPPPSTTEGRPAGG